MKIGYACINTSLNCTANRTFRLKSYSTAVLKEKIKSNIDCLFKILKYNQENRLLFFRIGSGLVPFASHSICKFNWQDYFKKDFIRLGDYIKKHNFRISTHPGHFVLINSLSKAIVSKSVKDLVYHCQLFDLMKLDSRHKVQIHIGGVYNDKQKSMARFVNNFKKLPQFVKKRLVIENDDKSYNLNDCWQVSRKIKIPIVLDAFHHQILNNGETVKQALTLSSQTWRKKDGVPMLDYSSQAVNKKIGSHAASIDLNHFKKLMRELRKYDFDLMIEIKDKEQSALKAVAVISNK